MRAKRNFDRTGLRYGRLLVISYAGTNHNKERHWNCKCDCGNLRIVRGNSLVDGNTVSCGCLQKEVIRKRAFIHGQAGDHRRTPEYISWYSIKKRCLNPKNKRYHRYGGRGITICDRWLDSFENFFADMGKKPSKSHSIDRINNDGNYEPGNCRWATTQEQRSNRSDNHFLSFDGKTLTIGQWSKILGIKTGTLRTRIKRGWSIADALTKRPK